MEDLAGSPSISKEFPYGPEDAAFLFDECHPTRCIRCGSEHTSSYTKLMVATKPTEVISGDLILHPIRVITCLICNRTTYKDFQTLRDS
jgi:hypothetical protein